MRGRERLFLETMSNVDRAQDPPGVLGTVR